MIIIIFGAPGSGKSSLNTYFIKDEYLKSGPILLKKSIAKLEEVNKSRLTPLAVPSQPPIFSDFNVKIKVGYEKYFSPYFVNGFYLGMPNDTLEVQYIPPFSKIHLSEAQRYYDSRKKNLPDWVSRFYEMHRHYNLDIFLDVQRPGLIDLNVRENCRCFLEVVKMVNKKNDMGGIVSSTFYCREFANWRDCEQYLNTGAKTYKNVTFENDGDIFRCFDSFNYFNQFLKSEKNQSVLLPFEQSRNDIYYYLSEPSEYRKSGSQGAKKSV